MFLTIIWKKYKYLIVLTCIVTGILAGSLALIFIKVGPQWRGVPLQFTGDSYFYYARMKEIYDGHPFIGNPFYIEHNNELAPAFFVADWLAAWPLWLGLSISATTIFNLFFWSLLFGLLFFLILKLCNLPDSFCLIGALVGYAASFSIIIRAVSLQTVLPAFLFFWLAMLWWQKRPSDKKAVWLLAAAVTMSIYVYTYLTQIIVVLLPLMIAYLSIKHRRQEAKYLAAACLLACIASIPFALYTWQQIHSPYFWETMQRVGLVYTHLPSRNFLTASFWVIAAISLWLLLWRWVAMEKNDGTYKTIMPFYVLAGTAMIMTAGSNILSGKESENAQHIERFIIVWLVISLTILAAYIWQYRSQLKIISRAKRIMLGSLLAIVLLSVLNYVRTGFSLVNMVRENRQTVIERQSYAAPLRWLEAQESRPVVIWTVGAEDVNNYIPIMTKHYVLAPSGLTYLLSDEEQAQRYLVYHYFDDLTLADIEDDFWSYAGVAHAIHQYKVYNRRVRVCRLLFLDKIGYNCGEIVNSAIALRGEDWFQNLYQQYLQEVKPNIRVELQKYHVAYVLVDNTDYPALQTSLPLPGVFSQVVYQDVRFTIYKLNY